MKSAELKAEITRRRDALAPALAEIEALERQMEDAASREFIAANGIKRHMVAHPDDAPGKPWFGDVRSFGKWLGASNCCKPWAAWNGCLYLTSELKLGRMTREAPGIYEHVKA